MYLALVMRTISSAPLDKSLYIDLPQALLVGQPEFPATHKLELSAGVDQRHDTNCVAVTGLMETPCSVMGCGGAINGVLQLELLHACRTSFACCSFDTIAPFSSYVADMTSVDRERRFRVSIRGVPCFSDTISRHTATVNDSKLASCKSLGSVIVDQFFSVRHCGLAATGCPL